MTPGAAATTIVSIRANAHRTVDPDSVSLHLQLTGTGKTKRTSRTNVDASLQRITDVLAASGGAVETAGVERAPLSWRVQSAHSHADHDDRGRPTGRYETYLSAAIRVRDFALLGAVETAIVAVDEADLHGVSWHVDDDNSAWPLVRADAIRSALLRGRDYAAAIGGEVISIEQVSDVGLLGGADHGLDNEFAVAAAPSGFAMESSRGAGEGLDPVPQRIGATIEARLRATAGALPR